jgi:hypothetical protein
MPSSSATIRFVARIETSMAAVSVMSWLVAPLWTWREASSETSETAAVSARTSGGTGLPAALPLSPISSGSKRAASQRETMT